MERNAGTLSEIDDNDRHCWAKDYGM